MRLAPPVAGEVDGCRRQTRGLQRLECGHGVVAADAGAIPEIATPDCGVLVPPGDAHAMAEGIRAFYERDPDVLGTAARARVEAEYSWDTAMRGLLCLYRGTVIPGSARTPNYATS